MRRRGWTIALAAALSAVAVAPTSGCFLLVGSGGGLETSACHFQGESTPCGQCIVERCQPRVNACCADPACDSSLGYLDGCASSGDVTACTLLGHGSFLSASTAFHALSSCVEGQCPACVGGLFDAGVPRPDTGTPDADASGPAWYVSCDKLNENDCFCLLDQGTPRTTPACSSATVTNAVCCADVGWPKPGSGSLQPQCECETLGCSNIGTTSCMCQGDIKATANGDALTCGSGWGPCCVAPGEYCSCSSSACSPEEVSVTACTPAAVGCPKGKFQVGSCSP